MSIDLKNKKICVTGGAGFLGRRVIAELEARGCQDVFVVRSRDYDLVHSEAVEKLYCDVKPQIVIHLAAVVGGIGANQVNPGKYFYDNLMMGVNLIEAARHHAVEKFTQIGTICAYPNYTPVPFKEEDLWNGYPEETNAPYGVAKKALLVGLQAYRAQYNLNGIYLLPVNLYGPGDNFDLQTSHVIPALIRKCVEATDNGRDFIEVWGTGSATREFLFVDDAARGIVTATENYDGAEPVNLGAAREISIRDLVNLIANLCEFKGEIRWDATKPDGQPRRALDTTKARDLFGFEAQMKLEDGLRETIDWYRRHRREQT